MSYCISKCPGPKTIHNVTVRGLDACVCVCVPFFYSFCSIKFIKEIFYFCFRNANGKL